MKGGEQKVNKDKSIYPYCIWIYEKDKFLLISAQIRSNYFLGKIVDKKVFLHYNGNQLFGKNYGKLEFNFTRNSKYKISI